MEILITKDVIDKNQYINDISELIDKSRNLDATVIPHTEEELLYRYDKSLVYINNKKIIGHLSMYSTCITELVDLNIGELGSVIVDPEYRGKGLGYDLIKTGINIFGDKYDGIIGATINKTMVHLLSEIGLDEIKFPLSYYNEGKKYLSGLMKGGEKEFDDRAKCLLLENTDDIKSKILKLI